MVSSNDVQKLFLQAVASRRIVSKQLATKIWFKCVEAVQGTTTPLSSLLSCCSPTPYLPAVDETIEIEYGENMWDGWVNRINSALEPLAIEFAHVFDEATGKDMYALVRGFSAQCQYMQPNLCIG